MANEPLDVQGPPQLDPQAPTVEPVQAGDLKRIVAARFGGEMIEHNPRLRRVARVSTRGGFVQTGNGVRFVRILNNVENRPLRLAGERQLVSADEYGRPTIRTTGGHPIVRPLPMQPLPFARKRVIAEPRVERVETIDLTAEPADGDNDLVHENEYRMVAGFAKRPVETATSHVSGIPHAQPAIRNAPIHYIRSAGGPSIRGATAMRPITVSRPAMSNVGNSMYGNRVMRQIVTRGGLVQRPVRRVPISMTRMGFPKPPLDIMKRAPIARRGGSTRFESNEEEERALAQSIAHEEELMRQEEEERDRAKNSKSLSLFPSLEGEFRRVEEGLRQKELATRCELERRRLAPSNPLLSTYTSPFARDAAHRHQQLIEQTATFMRKPSNLAPSKDDTPDMRAAKQVLDGIIAKICKTENPEKTVTWQRTLPQPVRIREANSRFPLVRHNQQELVILERMDSIKREVLKRRQRIEETAERETGILPPWKRSRTRARPRPKKKPVESQSQQSRKENINTEIEIKVEDPSQISLGGDSVVYSSTTNNENNNNVKNHNISGNSDPVEETTPDDFNDILDEVHNLTFDQHLQELTPEHLSILDPCNLLETEEILEEGKLNDAPTTLILPTVASPKKEKTSAKAKRKSSPEKPKRESISEKSEASATTASTAPTPAPRGRGRPPKVGKRDKAAVPSLALDASKCRCICKEAFDPRRFYASCTKCGKYYHGSCVGLGDKKSKKMKGFVCEECKRTSDDDVYCVCRKPYDSNQFYVGCDGCEGWFHPSCVGTTQTQVEKHESYLCPSCKDKTTSTTTRKRR